MGPNCNIFTPCHPIHYELRKEKVTEYALPVTVGSHSWIGGDVVITPGVTIGENCVIGAGSVVTKDIPDNSIAVGNPCKVIRQVNDKNFSLGICIYASFSQHCYTGKHMSKSKSNFTIRRTLLLIFHFRCY